MDPRTTQSAKSSCISSWAVNLGDISSRSRISDLKKISVPNLGDIKRERYRDDDDEISVGGGLEEEVNALDDVDSDAELLDCN
ncbi:hypothetical protein Tco_1277284 [Tanacetum coccineum]